MDDVVDLVRRSLAAETAEPFADRVDDQAASLREAIAAGEYDNDGFAVGLEIELYAIDAEPQPVEPEEDDEDDVEGDDETADPFADDLDGSEGGAWDGSLEASEGGQETPTGDDDLEGYLAGDDAAADDRDGGEGEADEAAADAAPEPYMDPEEWEGRLRSLPDSVFEGLVSKELGVHNAEVNTDPDSFDATGLEVQTASVEMRVKRARDAAAEANAELILDGMWTIPPAEGTEAYLSAVEEREGVVIAENMRTDPRYVAIDNHVLDYADGEIALSVPGVERTFPTILFESLTSSIQPHLQVPSSARFPAYYNAAIRTMGPVLALTTNSPFLPADLYNRVQDPYDLLAETHHELRIAAFEQSVNETANEKVRVPADIETALDVVDGVVADDTYAPFLREWIADGGRESHDDRYWEFDHKRGTFWRWLRCVVGGDPVDGAGDERSLRIEYRPIPTQPTVRDLVAAQTLVVGLIRGLVDRDHPLVELPWQDAKRCFYDAARNGLDADLAWVTQDGVRVTDPDVVYDEIFELARHGMAVEDVPETRIDEFLEPLERRRDAGVTPSDWKIQRVREYLDDGADLASAIPDMQRDYYELSREEQSFADWL